MSSLTKIPAGVQYFFDDEVRLRRHVEQQAMQVFAGWAYDEIIVPMFDYHDLFARGMGAERAERTYRFTDRDGALLALRPEMTSLVARTVATRFVQRARPIRLCYSGEVFRYDEPSERAAREFHQLGIEQIGQPSPTADIEVLLIAAELLTAIGLNEFRITLAHVDFFNGVANALEMNEAKRSQLRELIDRRNSLALDEFLQANAPNMTAERRQAFCHLTQIAGKAEALTKARETLRNETSRTAIEQLAAIYDTLTALGLGEQFDIDFGDAGGLEYYTGLTFKVYVPGWGTEIGSGGRYDNLISNFGAAEPAVGFSFALDGLVGALRNKPTQLADHTRETIQLQDNATQAFQTALTLRKLGRNLKLQ
ncbi:MAG TPA: ATP phosphoribosyltransferase regulatory subunit [Blastocatellia bacterium]|nr:ATP phosphoribosyltransferase regulatory subunit [Blastocatellia bacterium]